MVCFRRRLQPYFFHGSDRCRKIQYEALLPALIASYTAAYTSHTLGLEKFYVPLKDTLEISDAGMAVRLIVLGIIFGLTGRLFSFLLAKSKKFFGEKSKIHISG